MTDAPSGPIRPAGRTSLVYSLCRSVGDGFAVAMAVRRRLNKLSSLTLDFGLTALLLPLAVHWFDLRSAVRAFLPRTNSYAVLASSLAGGSRINMLDYEKIFVHYKNRDFEGVYGALAPWLDLWAGDVLRPMKMEHNRCWRAELIAAGTASLVVELPKRFENGRMASGQHVVNSLRLPIRKTMQSARRSLFPVPIPIAQTFRNRLATGKPAFKSWELRRRVAMEGRPKSASWETGASQAQIDRRFFAPVAGAADDYWRFTYSASEAAIELADSKTNRLVQAMLGGATSVTEAAKLAGVARGTVRDRLRRLGPAIIASASPELRDLGLEHRPDIWVPAAKNEQAGNNAKGLSALWKPESPFASMK